MMVVVVVTAAAADAAIMISWGFFNSSDIFLCTNRIFLLVVPTGMPPKHKYKEYGNK
jgi:hypothetical protein